MRGYFTTSNNWNRLFAYFTSENASCPIESGMRPVSRVKNWGYSREIHDFPPPITLHRSDSKTQRFGLRVCWEVCFASRNKFQPTFNCCQLCPTVVAGAADTPLGLVTVLRFVRLRVMDISLSASGLQVRRETAQIAKGWPFSRSSLTWSRSFATCDNQPDACVPSTSCRNQ